MVCKQKTPKLNRTKAIKIALYAHTIHGPITMQLLTITLFLRRNDHPSISLEMKNIKKELKHLSWKNSVKLNRENGEKV